MGEPLGYTPPCLCCRISDDDGPHFDRRWKAEFKEDYDGYIDLFQPGEKGPCAWIHRSCQMEFMLHTLKRNSEGKPEFAEVCIVCETKVPGETLWPLVWEGQTRPPVFWAHPDCLADYQR
jgi:hypothetical protein